MVLHGQMPVELRCMFLLIDLIIYGMINNILGAVVYLSTAIVFGGSTALLMLFIKETATVATTITASGTK